MIFKITFSDKMEYANAQTELHLLQEYYNEHGEDFLEITELEVITEEAAKLIMIKCDEEKENFTLHELSDDDGFFKIIASTDWD